MDFERWKLFLLVSEMGSLSKAAVILNRPQPVISRHINALEGQCGCSLFYRNGRGVALTEVAQAILPRVRAMIDESEQIMLDIKNQAGVAVGRVSVGLLPSLGLAAELVAAVTEQFPGVELHLAEAAGGQLAEQVATGRIDLALVLREPGGVASTEEALLRLPMCLAAPAGDPVAATGAVTMRAVEGLPLILARPPNALRMNVEQAARQAGVTLRYGPQVDSLVTQKQLVASRMGYTITTRMAVRAEVEAGTLWAADVVDPPLELMLVLVRSNQRPATLAIRKVARLLSELLRKLPDRYRDDPSPPYLPIPSP